MTDEATREQRKPRRRTPISPEEWREVIEDRLDHGSDRMEAMQKAILALQGAMLENTRITKEGNDKQALTNKRTDEIYEYLLKGKSIWSTFSVVGGFFAWILTRLGTIATAGLAIYGVWYAFRHPGQLPPNAVEKAATEIHPK